MWLPTAERCGYYQGTGPTQEEKAAIEAKAAAVVGQDHVVDQMEISPQGH
jgi:osmotically-inducible protein OsmY